MFNLADKMCIRDSDRAASKKSFRSRMPEMIAPESVHVAWEKAARYFGVKMVHAPLRSDPVSYTHLDVYKRQVVEQERKGRAKSVEESIRELGLSREASKKLIKDFKSGEIKRYHLADIKMLSDLLEALTPAQQKKAIDLIVENRKNFYQVNKEELSLFVLGSGQAGAYHIDLWYRGLTRTLDKMEKMLRVDRDILSEADPEQKKQLKKYFKRTGGKISEVNTVL